jgi:uncharacterized membrane protein (DUF4010 family)
MSQDGLAIRVAITGFVIAGVVNSLVKGGMATLIGDRHVGSRVAVSLLASAVTGLATLWLLIWRTN